MAPERDKERRDVEGEEDSEKCGVMCGCQRVMAEVRTSDHEDSDVGHEATAVGLSFSWEIAGSVALERVEQCMVKRRGKEKLLAVKRENC